MQVPFLDLQAQYRSLEPELEAAALGVLRSGRYILGPEVEAFEAEFAAYCGTRHAIGVNSGTSAIHLALLGLGIGPGHEVITVPMTFVASAAAILYTGAQAVLVDVDPVTLTMDPNRLEAAITKRTRAILPVHLHGQPADMGPILEIAAAHGLAVVEDACQAHGAEYRGRRAGSMGVCGCFSFYPGKNLGAAGDGGALTTDDDDLALRLRLLRDWGAERKYEHLLPGFNYRLDALQAAILRVKLQALEGWTEARRSHAARYLQLLPTELVATAAEVAGRRHVYHVFAIHHRDRDCLASELGQRGIGTNIHYPIPVHLQPAYGSLGYGPGRFPVAEAAAAELLSLPMYPELTGDQVEAVVAAVCRTGQGLRV